MGLEGTRERLLQAAVEVIRSQGIVGAKTAEIARMAGCSEGALYYHFPDKQTLLSTALREQIPDVVAYFRRFPNKAGSEAVRDHLMAFSRRTMLFLKQVVLMSAVTLSDPDLLRRHHHDMHSGTTGPTAVFDALSSYIAAEQEELRVRRDIDPDAGAALLVGALHARAFLHHLHHVHGATASDESFIENVVDTLMTGLAPDKPA